MDPRGAMPLAAGHLMPIVRHDGHEFLLAMELMTSVPISVLRDPPGSIAAHRDDIARAVDWLFAEVQARTRPGPRRPVPAGARKCDLRRRVSENFTLCPRGAVAALY
jgi:hypothetical protein